MHKIVSTALAVLLLVPATAATAQSFKHREAWQELRETNADLFRRPAYVAPRGMRHPEVASGEQLDPAFYDRSLWLEDFASYRLPTPADGQHYVRYRNDLLRMNVHSGRVIQVYKDFFIVG